VTGYPNCPATYGSDNNWNAVGDPPAQANAWTKWTLVDPSDPTIPASGQYVKTTGINCYDASAYTYPADGSANKPHTWSYYKDESGKCLPNQPPTTHQEMEGEHPITIPERLTIITSSSVNGS
jgi:hypothetical protein